MRSDTALALVWATAEATFWPIMPDAVLVPLSTRRPERWLMLSLAAAAGSATGGAIPSVTLLGERSRAIHRCRACRSSVPR